MVVVLGTSKEWKRNWSSEERWVEMSGGDGLNGWDEVEELRWMGRGVKFRWMDGGGG